MTQITKDMMLFFACFAPILCGVFIKFAIPLAEKYLSEHFGVSQILVPYYLIFDLFLALITPLMFCFISAMVILGEIDDNISNYMAVTPLGSKGYLLSRLGFPIVISFIITILLLSIFPLTQIALYTQIGVSLLVSGLGFIVSLLIVSISANKVEGMAVSKLSGLFMIGIPAPFFITSNVQYILWILPSFWLAKFALENSPLYFIFGIITSIIWILLLIKKFVKKIVL